MNFRLGALLVFFSFSAACFALSSTTPPTVDRIVADLLAGGKRLCPYCSLCSYTGFCDGVCRERPMLACFLCQFKGHCQTTCVKICKRQDPCIPNPCNVNETCERTDNGKHRCTCLNPPCLNKAKVVLQSANLNPQ